MTIVEKAAYLKGLTEGLGVEPESRDGKLWSALNDLLSDMAHEIEDLQAASMDYAEVIDDICEDLSYLEELTGGPDSPEDFDEFEDYEEEDDEDKVYDLADYGLGGELDDEGEEPADGEEDEEVEYDGVMYDVTCPSCGEEISFDEETLEKGSIKCPNCGEMLEFDLGEDKE